jgi:hypothetical protein
MRHSEGEVLRTGCPGGPMRSASARSDRMSLQEFQGSARVTGSAKAEDVGRAFEWASSGTTESRHSGGRLDQRACRVACAPDRAGPGCQRHFPMPVLAPGLPLLHRSPGYSRHNANCRADLPGKGVSSAGTRRRERAPGAKRETESRNGESRSTSADGAEPTASLQQGC